MTGVPGARPMRYAAGLGLAALLAACGGPSGSAADPTPATPPSTAPTTAPTTGASSSVPSPADPSTGAPAVRTIAISVSGRQVRPAPRTVDLAVGERLTLVVTSDHDDELHAHGFGVEGRLQAGQPFRVTLTGAAPGLYEVETHDPPLRLLMVAVR